MVWLPLLLKIVEFPTVLSLRFPIGLVKLNFSPEINFFFDEKDPARVAAAEPDDSWFNR